MVVASVLMKLGDLEAHLASQRRVEIGQRLVEKKRLGLAHDGAADGDALALAAGELAGAAFEIVGEVERRRRPLDLAGDRVLGLAGHLQREADIAAHGHMRIERVGLEDHGQSAPGGRFPGDVDAVDLDRAAADILQPGDEAQQRGLAAAGGADEDDEFAVIDVEVDAGNDLDLTEDLAHALECDLAHGRTS